MSFMFNPVDFDDQGAINRISLDEETAASIVSGTGESAVYISELLSDLTSEKERPVIAVFDGYIGALWEQSLKLVTENLESVSVKVIPEDFRKVFKSSDLLDELFKGHLPSDREKDPVLLFGKLFKGTYDDILDDQKTDELIARLRVHRNSGGAGKVILVYGCGSAIKRVRQLADYVFYLDVAPKNVILRARKGLFANLGDTAPRGIDEFIRRCYYVDYEIASRHRGELLTGSHIDFYIDGNDLSDLKMMPRRAFDSIMSALVRYPVRCKPVYLEGVWGGQFIRKFRNLPRSVRNVAWAYDLIPLEVSIVVAYGKTGIEFPFFTFVQKEGLNLMGKECVEKFKGYFPVRFNYDDTWHSSGNMSIQVHSGHEYNVENFDELGRQDEGYYVVATGHGARTFAGFSEDADVDEFICEVKKSETEHTVVDYEKYVNYVRSYPGMQVLLPAGTIHASGRNQVVLETGSLTVGSYTYKLYDYLRPDLNGRPRPIHTWHGERVLMKDRKTAWVRENLVRPPVIVRKGEGWAEYIVGEHDLLYFSLRRFEFEKKIEDDTRGRFHVLTLVDGEKVIIRSAENPELFYEQYFLDVVIVPANMGRYIVKNEGNQPVCIHKAMLK
ncbi:MAG TPA: phosphoheptose isomerase [Bacteroidales bacterium]|nr:phosphoheptose isomerase [Bacteroidales bacterium]HPM19347.1 phosphoheptose isomerase [Bacteroidales bacterium]HQG77569.1 phosphoheptose isomerase [Bacteroidales bacterium]